MKRLPIYLWLPFGWSNSNIGYCVSYVYLVCTMLYSMIPISFTVIIWYIMLNYSVKYKLLKSQLRNIETETQLLSHQKLILLIEEHRKIKESFYVKYYVKIPVKKKKIYIFISTIDRFKSCFENLFFTQINTSGIGICFSIYILAFVNLINK